LKDFRGQSASGLAVFLDAHFFIPCAVKALAGMREGRRLGAMSGTAPASRTNGKTVRMRVLGVDPAATGPRATALLKVTGGAAACCIMVHDGRRKTAQGVCGRHAQDVHALLCRLIESLRRDAMAVESVFHGAEHAHGVAAGGSARRSVAGAAQHDWKFIATRHAK